MAGPTRSSETRRSKSSRMTKAVTIPRGQEVALECPRRPRRRPTKPVIIPAPYPWASSTRARVRTMTNLLSVGINTIKGDVQCERCHRQYQIEYDLQEKFNEVNALLSNIRTNRPLPIWINPVMSDCRICEENNCVKPIISGKKRRINWLFLFLGQLLGFLSLSQLEYFGKHTQTNRYGSKQMHLYTTFFFLGKQLQGTY